MLEWIYSSRKIKEIDKLFSCWKKEGGEAAFGLNFLYVLLHLSQTQSSTRSLSHYQWPRHYQWQCRGQFQSHYHCWSQFLRQCSARYLWPQPHCQCESSHFVVECLWLIKRIKSSNLSSIILSISNYQKRWIANKYVTWSDDILFLPFKFFVCCLQSNGS